MSTKMNSTTRYEVITLLKQKAKGVCEALDKEIASDPSAVRSRLLAASGYTHSAEDLRTEKRRLERDLRDVDLDEDPIIQAIHEESENLESTIEAEISVIRQETETQVRQIKSRAELRVSELRSSKASRLADIEQREKDRANALHTSAAPGTVERLRELEKLIPSTELLERTLRQEIDKRIDMIDRSRSRLKYLVNDAVSQAQTELLTCETLEQARMLVDRIPSVAEVIAIAENPEGGLEALVARFNPSHRIALAAPKSVETADENPHEDPPSRQIDNESMQTHLTRIVFQNEEVELNA